MNYRKLLPVRLTRTTPKGRIGLAVFYFLRIAEGVLYLGSLTFYMADWSSQWLFSDWMDDVN